MSKLPFNSRLSVLALALAFGLSNLTTTAWANSLPLEQKNTAQLDESDENVEFSATFLKIGGNGAVIDISRFQRKNSVLPGEYPASVWVNGKEKGEITLIFRDSKDNTQPETHLCFTPDLATLLDVKPSAIARSPEPEEKNCVFIEQAIPQGKAEFITGTQQLYFTIAQALTVHHPRDYIAPSRWQTGDTAAFVDYDVNHSRYDSQDAQSSHLFLNIRSGINLGNWAFRHSGSKSWSKNNGSAYNTPYQTYETYLQRDVAQLRGIVTLGDFYTSGQFVEGFSLRGVDISSDDRMLSPSQLGFAPRVQGIANSNAVVTIRQNGNIIYQTNVPPGPFVIDDLYSTGYNGDLLVEVREADGKVRSFIVPFSNVAPLIRVGQFRYQLAAGRYRSGREIYPDYVAQGMLQYGVLNNLTLNTGVTYHKHYFAGSLGVGVNSPIGAFSVDSTWTRSEFLPLIASANQPKEVRTGYSLHGSYSINFNRTRTNITLAAYRYSSRNFYNLSDVINANHTPGGLYTLSLRPKNQYQLSLIQDLKQWGNIYLVGSTRNYWNKPGTYSQYQISYANRFKWLNYQIGFSQTLDRQNRQRDNQIYLSMSVPLGNSHSLSSNYTRNTAGSSFSQLGLNGSLGKNSQWSYGLYGNVAHQDGYRNISGNMSYRNTYFNFDASASQDNRGSRQISSGLSGVLVAHRHGLTFGESVGDSFAIVHADQASGAEVNSGQGQVLDWFGNAIVHYTQPYRVNEIGIDPQNLPLNIEFDSTEKKIIPRANSIHVVDFTTKRNSLVLFNLTRPNGDLLPMASEALDEKGRFIGYVVQNGVLFANALQKPKGTIKVSWGNGENNQCHFDYSVNLENTTQMQQYEKVCQ